jgi:tetratricopeptide (TPR) repeat protein
MLFLSIVALPFALAQADCDFSFSNYARAAQLHDMGDYERALQHYHCAQLEDPDDAIIPILIENVYEDIANASSAWSREGDAAKTVPCDPAQDHALLGIEAHEAGDDNLALIHLQCVLLGDPSPIDALYRMGKIHIDRGETHEAKHYFDQADRAAKAVSANEDLLTYLLGEDARKILDEDAVRGLTLTSPDPAETGEYLPPGHDYLSTVLIVIWTRGDDGGLHGRQADTDYTLGRLEQALKQDPTRVDLRCELGRLYHERSDYAAAFRHFSILIRETLGGHCNR